MELATAERESAALYSRWVRMWNGELELLEDIIADDFIVHLAEGSSQRQLAMRDASAARAWVDAIRSRNDAMTYRPKGGPLVSGATVVAYWSVIGRGPTTNRSALHVAKEGVDILRVANGKFVECWTANFDARTLRADGAGE